MAFPLASSVVLAEDRRNDTWRGLLAGEMSPFEQRLRERLGRENQTWPGEFDQCLEQARAALAELREGGR